MKRIFVVFGLSLVLWSCGENSDTSSKLFQKLNPDQSGITFTNTLTENDSLNYFTYSYLYMGGGIAAGDLNNDGLIDLFFTGNMVPNRLYLNKGGLKFEDITEKAGIAGDDRWYTGVTMADVNGDGFLDIYCSVGGKFGPKENQLYINQGDLTFKEQADTFGLDDKGNSVQSTFFDYDKDGDLDM
ncbi:MAG: FG-GAP repeat domain-containing protein [Flavobacteriaceae bacterium]